MIIHIRGIHVEDVLFNLEVAIISYERSNRASMVYCIARAPSADGRLQLWLPRRKQPEVLYASGDENDKCSNHHISDNELTSENRNMMGSGQSLGSTQVRKAI